jgi:hypothetical protein
MAHYHTFGTSGVGAGIGGGGGSGGATRVSPLATGPPPAQPSPGGQFASPILRHAATDCLAHFTGDPCKPPCAFRHTVRRGDGVPYCRDWVVWRHGDAGQYCPAGARCPYAHPHRRIVALTDCPACLAAACTRAGAAATGLAAVGGPAWALPAVPLAPAATRVLPTPAGGVRASCVYTGGLPCALRHSDSLEQATVWATVAAVTGVAAARGGAGVTPALCAAWQRGDTCAHGAACPSLHAMLVRG